MRITIETAFGSRYRRRDSEKYEIRLSIQGRIPSGATRRGQPLRQPEGLPEGRRGWSASDTPGPPRSFDPHPGGMPETKLNAMGSTYYSLHYHWICSTKERRRFIKPDWRGRLHEYFGGTVRGLDGIALKVGGVEDHVHALIGLKPVHCIADFTRELKKATSVWAAANHDPEFQWQEGYSIFTVSASLMEKVSRYIERQEEHHRKLTFEEELRQLLEKHGVRYDPKYLV